MNISSNFERRKRNPLVYAKFLRQAWLPSWLYGAKVFTPTPTLLTKLERSQSWRLKIICYVSKFAPNQSLQKLSGLNSIKSEIAPKELLFFGRMITEPKTARAVRSLLMSRAESHLLLFIEDYCLSQWKESAPISHKGQQTAIAQLGFGGNYFPLRNFANPLS